MKKIRIGILAVLLTGITGLAAANNRLRMFLKDIGLIIPLISLLMLVLLKVIIMDIMAVID